MKKIFNLFCGTLLTLAMGAALASCSEDNDPTYLDEVRVSSSYVAIPMSGGSTSITIDAASDWNFVSQRWIQGKDTIYAATPQWLDVNFTSGVAGKSDVTFTAPSTLDGRSCEVLLSCGGKTPRINIIQGVSSVSEVSVAEVMAGPDKTYRVTGTVTRIANTVYGNWYMNDGTSADDLYIYGTLDKAGKSGQNNSIAAWGIEVGDEVTVEGPKTVYGSTVELVNVTVVKINKSLIKVDALSSTDPLPAEGGEVTATITCKGNGVTVEIPEEAKSWLVISALNGNDVTFRALPNEGGDRSATVVFKTTDGKKEYTSETTIKQRGSIVSATVAEFLAAPVGETQYRITGVISKVAKAEYGNIYVKDFSGETYVYGIGAKGDFEKLGLKEGDVVTLVGKRGEYKEQAQMTGAICESSISVNEVTIADFLTKEDNPAVYYKVTGTIKEIANTTYGNLWLKDGDNELYVYGCYPGWGATGDARKGLIGELGIEPGDILTVIGVKSTYNGQTQLANGIYFSHQKAE